MRQLLSLLLLVPLGLIVLAVVGVLAPIIRWTSRLAVAGLATLFASWILPPHLAHGWTLIGVFLATLLLLSGRRRRVRRPGRLAAERVIDQSSAPAPDVTAAAGALARQPAWRELRGLADWRTRRRLDTAADACNRYLLLAATQEDPSAQLPIKIEKHLPAIVADCVRHSQTATPAERQTLVSETLATLESLAGRAESRRRELAHHAQGEFRARQAHLNRPED